MQSLNRNQCLCHWLVNECFISRQNQEKKGQSSGWKIHTWEHQDEWNKKVNKDIFLGYACVHAQLLSHVQLFCNPRDCSPLGSSVHGTSQARILEWVTISFSRGSSFPRDQTWVSCIGRWILNLVGYSLWGCKESDMSEWLSTHKTDKSLLTFYHENITPVHTSYILQNYFQR